MNPAAVWCGSLFSGVRSSSLCHVWLGVVSSQCTLQS